VLVGLKNNKLRENDMLMQENDALRREQERATSPEDVQMLHEEMIVCKLREAESSMVTKQLQNELFEIQRLWQVLHCVFLSLETVHVVFETASNL